MGIRPALALAAEPGGRDRGLLHGAQPRGDALRSARPKRLRFMVFNVAGRIVSHAARLTVRVGAKAEKIADLIAARIRLAKLKPIASTG